MNQCSKIVKLVETEDQSETRKCSRMQVLDAQKGDNTPQ